MHIFTKKQEFFFSSTKLVSHFFPSKESTNLTTVSVASVEKETFIKIVNLKYILKKYIKLGKSLAHENRDVVTIFYPILFISKKIRLRIVGRCKNTNV